MMDFIGQEKLGKSLIHPFYFYHLGIIQWISDEYGTWRG